MKKVNVGLRGSAAGRGRDYEEKFVAKKPLSPSKDFKMEDTKEYKVSEPSTLHLAWPSVVCCGSSAPHNRTNFDHETTQPGPYPSQVPIFVIFELDMKNNTFYE